MQPAQPPFSEQSTYGPGRPPRRVSNADVRSREYLTSDEVERLQKAAKNSGRYGHRDSLLIALAYRHGLRVGELAALTWEQFELGRALFHVKRLKRGDPSVHTLQGFEVRSLRQLKRDTANGVFVFASERGGPLGERAIHKIVSRAGKAAGFGFPVHPHMLRHAAGYGLANAGVDTRAIQGYLGHRNIQHTVKYTQLSPDRFKDFGKIL